MDPTSRSRWKIQPQRYKSLTMYLGHADYDASNGGCTGKYGSSKTECEKAQCAKQCYSGEYGPYGQNPTKSDPRISTLYTKVYSGGYITDYDKYSGSSTENIGGQHLRMYAGCGYDIVDGDYHTYPDGTTDCDASPQKRVDECAAACYTFLKGYRKMMGFFVIKATGRCYCSIPRGAATQYTPRAVSYTHLTLPTTPYV